MGENKNNRDAYERVVTRLVEHQRAQGGIGSEREARQQAGAIARETDAKREAGALRNKSRRSQPAPEIERREPRKIMVGYRGKK